MRSFCFREIVVVKEIGIITFRNEKKPYCQILSGRCPLNQYIRIYPHVIRVRCFFEHRLHGFAGLKSGDKYPESTPPSVFFRLFETLTSPIFCFLSETLMDKSVGDKRRLMLISLSPNCLMQAEVTFIPSV